MFELLNNLTKGELLLNPIGRYHLSYVRSVKNGKELNKLVLNPRLSHVSVLQYLLECKNEGNSIFKASVLRKHWSECKCTPCP